MLQILLNNNCRRMFNFDREIYIVHISYILLYLLNVLRYTFKIVRKLNTFYQLLLFINLVNEFLAKTYQREMVFYILLVLAFDYHFIDKTSKIFRERVFFV